MWDGVQGASGTHARKHARTHTHTVGLAEQRY